MWKLLDWCLKNFFRDNCASFIVDDGKWLDTYGKIKFSLSHSNEMVAVGVSKECSIGVDIEMCSEKILKLSSILENITDEDNFIESLTKKWTEKESLFKSRNGTTFNSKVVCDALKNNYVLTVCSCCENVDFIEINLENIV